MSRQRTVPTPSDAVLIKLAGVVNRVDEILSADKPVGKAPVGLNTVKNDRRRAMEAVMVLLADPEVRSYLADMERLGFL
jgi:hypothetical protein